MTNEILRKEEIYKKYDFQMNISTLDEGYLFSLIYKDNPIAEIKRSDFDELDSLAVLLRYAGDSKHKQSALKASAYKDALELIYQSSSARKDANLIYTLQQFFSLSNQSFYSFENNNHYINSFSNGSKKTIQSVSVFDEMTLDSLRDQLMFLYYELAQPKANNSSNIKVNVAPNME